MAIQRPQFARLAGSGDRIQRQRNLASGETLGRAGRSCSAVDMSRELVSGVSSLRAGKLRPVRRMEQVNESAGLNASVGPRHWKSAPAREAPVCAVHRPGARVAHDCAPKPCYLSPHKAFPFTRRRHLPNLPTSHGNARLQPSDPFGRMLQRNADVICRICRRQDGMSEADHSRVHGTRAMDNQPVASGSYWWLTHPALPLVGFLRLAQFLIGWRQHGPARRRF
jgi:hypothetical protein